MANQMKCPRCRATLDVSNYSKSGSARCPSCGAMVRVPTERIAKVVSPAPPAAPPPPPPRAPQKRGTDIFRKMSNVKAPGMRSRPGPGPATEGRGATSIRRPRSNMGLWIGLGIGLLVVAGIGFAAYSSKKATEEAAVAKKKKRAEAQAEADATRKAEQAAYDAQAAAEAAAAPKDEKKKAPPSLKKTDDGKYVAPPTFEPGAHARALKNARDLQDVTVDEALAKEYEALAGAARTDEIVKEDFKWMPCIIKGLASDNEAVARTSYNALHEVCAKHKISSSEAEFRNPVKLDLFNSAEARGGEYAYWAIWWSNPKNQEAVRTWGSGPIIERVVDPDGADWNRLMRDLRSGGAFDDPTSREGVAFEHIKAMGKAAYPKLAAYLEDEDIMLAKAACKVLNTLTGRDVPLPNEQTRAQVKGEWEAWLKQQ